MMKKYSSQFLFLVVGLVLGLLVGRVGTMSALASSDSPSPVQVCDENNGNVLKCLALLEQQNSERLVAIQQVLNEQQTSVTTINSDVAALASASAASSESTLLAINSQDVVLNTILDKQGEMGELEEVRLQMTLDRMSKLEATLETLFRKILQETGDYIIENLK
jgi:hypothetical protein